MKTTALLAAALLALPSCGLVPYPSNEEIMSAQLGPAPTATEVRAGVDGALDALLKDPYSKMVNYGTPQKGFYRMPFSASDKYAWLVPCEVNAKNSYGGYTGHKRWVFFFLRSKVVGWRDSQGMTREVGEGGLLHAAAHPAR